MIDKLSDIFGTALVVATVGGLLFVLAYTLSFAV